MNRHRAGHLTPRRQGRLLASRQPGHERVMLPRHQDGGVLSRGPVSGGQIRWPRTQSHPRLLNEAADTLAKAASSREPVLAGVFASDQHKPSVRYAGSEQADDGPSSPTPGANSPTTPPDPEVMELEGYPAVESNPPNN